MKTIILLIAVSIGMASQAQTQYEKGMRKAFDLWEAKQLDEASNLFERIANAETDNWLPAYYVAQIAIAKSWEEFETREEADLKANLDKAQEYINSMRSVLYENPYADHLQAQLYTVWVAHDGTKYGMKYAGTVGELYSKMVNKEPDNPIFIAAKAQWDMGSARYFGSSIEPYCAELQRAIRLFPTFKPATEFHPSYGFKGAKEAAEACSK